MARSCTPPPLSDRKRLLAEAHRRQSLALPRPSFSHAAKSENDEESDEADAMDIDESEKVRGRNAKRGDDALRSDVDEAPGELLALYHCCSIAPLDVTYPCVVAGSSSITPAKPSREEPRTPEPPYASTRLPTWTPLRVSHDSESSEESDSLITTSRRNKQRVSRGTPFHLKRFSRFAKDRPCLPSEISILEDAL